MTVRLRIAVVGGTGPQGRGPAYRFALATQEAQRLVPDARDVGSFHHLAASNLWRTADPLVHEDVLVVGDHDDAKSIVQNLAVSVTGKRGIDAGGLRLARQLEPLTAVLISMNKRYKTRSGVAITGVQKG